jgi:hypothetical protein
MGGGDNCRKFRTGGSARGCQVAAMQTGDKRVIFQWILDQEDESWIDVVSVKACCISAIRYCESSPRDYRSYRMSGEQFSTCVSGDYV